MSRNLEHFDRIASERAAHVERNRYYYDDLIALMKHLVPPDAKVLELGCGIGNVIDALPNAERTGIDYSEKMLDVARTRHGRGTRYIQDDIEALQHDERYDYVLVLDTLNSIYDVQSALTRIRRQNCAPHTRLIITHYNWLWEPILRLGDLLGIKTPMPEQSWLSRADLHALFDLAGFQVVTEGERLLLPRFFPGLSWLLNRVLAKLPLLRWLCLVHYVVARPRPAERQDLSVSILIPARNEAGNIERALQSVPKFGTSQEIIFVEGNSTDRTWETIQEMAEKYKDEWDIQTLQQPGVGKGDAVRAGFAVATRDILMILDGDLTVDPSDLPKFYEALATGAGEFVNGSRLVYPMEKQAMQLLNMCANKCFGVLFTWLLGQRIKDTLCGTKVLRKSDYERIAANRAYFGEFDPFGDFDLLFGAAKQNMKLIDVPVRYRERVYGATNINRWRHGVLLVKMCFFAASKLKFK